LTNKGINMSKAIVFSLCLLSGVAFGDISTGEIGQSNSASNGFSNSAISGQSNIQVNNSAASSAEYGNGVKCPESTLNVSPYAGQTSLGGQTAQTTGIAVGISIPLGDGGTCRQMAQNMEKQQRHNSKYEMIKLCIELKRNHVTIDPDVDFELFQTCRGVHMNGG
jgi:hypothetical protein